MLILGWFRVLHGQARNQLKYDLDGNKNQSKRVLDENRIRVVYDSDKLMGNLFSITFSCKTVMFFFVPERIWHFRVWTRCMIAPILSRIFYFKLRSKYHIVLAFFGTVGINKYKRDYLSNYAFFMLLQKTISI